MLPPGSDGSHQPGDSTGRLGTQWLGLSRRLTRSGPGDSLEPGGGDSDSKPAAAAWSVTVPSPGTADYLNHASVQPLTSVSWHDDATVEPGNGPGPPAADHCP